MTKPKFEKGQMVRVFNYYNDMIVKDSYCGLIIGMKKLPRALNPEIPCYIYSILPDGNAGHTNVQTAEEFAIDPIKEEE